MKYILGITGGSGAGKTEVSNILREHGIDIIDGDKVSRLIMEPGEEALKETVEAFGNEILDSDGRLKRRELGNIVFSDTKKLEILNKITHKYITEYFLERVKKSDKNIVGLDGAALFESGIDKLCDGVLGVISEPEIRIERIMKRDGILREQASNRISAQKNNEFYIENCDFLVYNNGNIEEVRKQIGEVLEKLGHAEEGRKRTDWQII